MPLTPEASLAVDLTVHALGVPVWLETTAPDPDTTKPERIFRRLLVMQDTGGAIRGPVRGDVYWGYDRGCRRDCRSDAERRPDHRVVAEKRRIAARPECRICRPLNGDARQITPSSASALISCDDIPSSSPYT